MSTVEKVRLTTLEVEGVEIEVSVTENGKFEATFKDETYDATEMRVLGSHLKDAVLSSRVEVPFVTADGRRGVMRGWHAGNRDILVTWADGTKDRIRQYEPVFRPENIDDERIDAIENVQAEQERLKARLRELQSGTEKADDILNEAVGEEITAFRRHREE
jgi:hypothetical protein